MACCLGARWWEARSLHVTRRFSDAGDSQAPNGAPTDRPRGGAHARSVRGAALTSPLATSLNGALWGGGGCLEGRHPAPHFLRDWWADSCAHRFALLVPRRREPAAPPPRGCWAERPRTSALPAARRRPRPGAVCRPLGRKTPARRGVAPVALACAVVARPSPATTPVTVVASAAAARTRPGRQRRGWSGAAGLPTRGAGRGRAGAAPPPRPPHGAPA